MRDLIRFFVAFFTITVNESREELSKMRKTLISVIGATLAGTGCVLAVKPTIGDSIWWTLPFWLFSAYRLYSIRRLIRLHITGEVLEFFQALARRLRNDPVEETGVLDNLFIRTYLSTISTAFLLQTALFLALPIYVNYTYGGKTVIMIIIVMLAVIIAIRNYGLFERLLTYSINLLVIGYAIGLIFVLFPHTGFYLGGLTKNFNFISSSTANRVNELEDLRAKQQEEIDNRFVDGIIAWQKKHPGQELPPEYQARLDRARKL